MSNSGEPRETIDGRDSALADALVQTFFRILLRCGIEPDDLVTMASRAARSASNLYCGHALGDSPEHHISCTDVVFHWRRDARFLDGKGVPRALPQTGPNLCFERLVEIAAPTCTSDAVLRYLLALGAVEARPDGLLELKSDSVLACAGRSSGVIAPQTILAHLGGFLGSVEFNVCGKQDNSGGRFERACYALLPRALLPVFQRLVEHRGQNFVDSVDEWLVRHTGPNAANGELQVGAGAYVFVNDSKKLK